ncbi:ABC transporter ATP-binding protein [Thermoproteota archaeon]
MDAIIEVQDLWKRFKIPHEKKTTVFENLARIMQILDSTRMTYEEFWALKGLSFSVEPGRSMGIIGRNGSGKSTLLKLIANILRPDKGKIKVTGKVASILELGVGFHPDLTVKENVLIYGSIMGLKNREIKKRINNILDFSNLRRFKDAKLKNLSSGMQMRLGFSTVIETDPEIFLIDEALAVGDMEFREKCMDKFKQFKEENKTILLVSHDLSLVREFCEKTMLLSKGEVVSSGKTEDVISIYEKTVK